MRFFEKGPPIPRELLEARDAGSVAFLCGAGVSVEAGLPSFEKLTKEVLKDLGVDSTPNLEQQISNYEFDKIFSHLEIEYGRTMVDKSVASFLQTDSSSFTGNHRSILTLSKNSLGHPQVITTNYDHLFEQAATEDGEKLTIYQSGSFPNLSGENALNGLVYLHGRLNDLTEQNQNQKFILSEKDFGHAYLTGALARQVLMEVIQSKYLILLGYSGNDPVVQYLFRGLQALPNPSDFHIYSFTDDNSTEAIALWKQRGVTPLVYDSSEGHGVLWESLEKWADMAKNPADWLSKMSRLYGADPLGLDPYERGQVTTMMKTRHGARAFLTNDPSPPRTWLLVFDANIRNKLDIRIDDDPCDESDEIYEDILSAHTSDSDFEHQSISLAAYGDSQEVSLPLRLQSLRSWICKHCDDPLVIWWMAGYRRIGSSFLFDLGIEYERRKSDLHDGAYKIISLAYDYFRSPPMGRYNYDWYGFEAQVRNHGWRKETIREFRRVTRPKIKLDRNYYSDNLNNLIAGELSVEQLISSGLVGIDVTFPKIDIAQLDVPSEYLYQLLRILTEHLSLATSYLTSIGIPSFHSDTLHQLEKPEFYDSDHQLKYLYTTALLLDRLIEHDVEQAKIILSLLDASDEYLQGQLFLYSFHKGQRLGTKYSVEKLLSLPDSVYWADHAKRERLFALKAIWNDLNESQKNLLEQRILEGDQSEYPVDSEGFVSKRRKCQIAITLGYLRQNKCDISAKALARYTELINTIENWNDAWCELSDDELERGARFVITDEEPGELLLVPISEILDKAATVSGRSLEDLAVEKAPFVGLVKANPYRAYLALIRSKHTEKIQIYFWQQFIGYLPDDTAPEFRALVIERIIRLPETILSAIVSSFVDWLKKQTKNFYIIDKSRTLDTWNRLLNRFIGLSGETFESSTGRSFSGGVELNRGPQSYLRALNSPAGILAKITLLLGQSDLEKGERRIPDVIRHSLHHLLSLPGEGSSAVASIMGASSNWLYWLDCNWYAQNVIPLVKNNSPLQRALINGLVHDRYVPNAELMQHYHPYLIEFVQNNKISTWSDNELENLITKITYSAINPKTDSRVFSFSDVRSCLRIIGKQHASKAIHTVGQVLKQKETNWDLTGYPFFKFIWPKEASFQTEESSRQIFYLLTNTEKFPARVHDLIELLRPIKHSDVLIHDLDSEDSPLWQNHPLEVLEILDQIILEKGAYQPHNLLGFLDKIVLKNPELRQSMAYKSLMDRA